METAALGDFLEEVADSRRRMRLFGRVASGFVVAAFGVKAALRGNWDLVGVTMVFAGIVLGFFEFVSWRYGRWAKSPKGGPERE